MKKEKIFITGGAGYIGCVLSAYLLNKGCSVKVFDNLNFGNKPLKAFLDNHQYEFIKGDICNFKLLRKEINDDSISTVVHLAAIVGDVPCSKDKRNAIKVNREASYSLIDLCKKRNIRFVFASTASNYGACPGNIASENDRLNPLSLYAETKIAVEEYLNNIKIDNSNFFYTILRLGTSYGLSPRMRPDLLIHFLVKEVVSKKRISIYGPELYRPYIHNTDIVCAMEKVIISSSELVGREIFNVVGENLNKENLLEILREFCDFEVEFFDKPEDLRDYKITGEKIKRKIGFETKIKLRDELPALIQAVKLGVY